MCCAMNEFEFIRFKSIQNQWFKSAVLNHFNPATTSMVENNNIIIESKGIETVCVCVVVG